MVINTMKYPTGKGKNSRAENALYLSSDCALSIQELYRLEGNGENR